ncbi:hypothetical protein JCM9140_3606 [Halalkalibacter wakoensis JCM 9140]|uniref:Uncharacterized protein n=1 Tax=Halalkalibacter wakoensis JCM 9140 TaxID=1236970 RepID=W4Q7Y0_9BACI|nr:hypothetical protein [Halalkalibacter wakoensis]GAE27459.1 hypothetical protein JCM9140_3606 [Halalkalibacter wakoensis JCM 9140]
MKNFFKIIGITSTLLLLSTGCSTAQMERKLAEENRIDTETYAYTDPEFIYDEEMVQLLANKFRLEELSIDNINTIMEDEIDAGRFNEVIIYMRHLLDHDEKQAALYMNRYYDALLAHVEHVSNPSAQLLVDAIHSARVQYEVNPDDQQATVQYATLLLYSEENYEQGLDLIFSLEKELLENEEEVHKRTLQTLAQAYLIDEQYEESLERLLTLRGFDSDDSLLFYQISYVLDLLGEHEEAAAYLDRAYSPTRDFLARYGTDSFGFYASFFNDEENE